MEVTRLLNAVGDLTIPYPFLLTKRSLHFLARKTHERQPTDIESSRNRPFGLSHWALFHGV